MKDKEMLYTVKDVCIKFGITRKTLFYYDKSGILKPSYRSGVQNQKIYNQKDLLTLTEIIRFRLAGLKIKEIKIILSNNNREIILSCLNTAKDRVQKKIIDSKEELANLNRLIMDFEN